MNLRFFAPKQAYILPRKKNITVPFIFLLCKCTKQIDPGTQHTLCPIKYQNRSLLEVIYCSVY